MNSGLLSHQQRGHTESETRFTSERPEKWGIDLVIPGLVVKRVIHYTTAVPPHKWRKVPPSTIKMKVLVPFSCNGMNYYYYRPYF